MSDPVRSGAPPPRLSWRPIESAPKDRPVLLWEKDANCATVGIFSDNYTRPFLALVHGEDANWSDDGPSPIFEATHWMPLPDPPMVDAGAPAGGMTVDHKRRSETMGMIIDPAKVTIPAGTVVHICGWPVEVTQDTEIEGTRANIELVTRDLYLRKQTPLPSAGAGSVTGVS